MTSQRRHRNHRKTTEPISPKWLLVGAVALIAVLIPAYLVRRPGFQPPDFVASLWFVLIGTYGVVLAGTGAVKFASLDRHGFIKFLHHEVPLSWMKSRRSEYADEGSYWPQVIGRLVMLVFFTTGLILGTTGLAVIVMPAASR